ncbi:unnamed protein product [Fraxinus pennsylvanica]|uniref:Uncharacterized protein n=1 Tax=Fraxinus pennsylvanica TaxID=56036 RepID=A0AAD1YZC5_9LAMI|nr:unnamed protein product [Fraxinus pennsylvanica]
MATRVILALLFLFCVSQVSSDLRIDEETKHVSQAFHVFTRRTDRNMMQDTVPRISKYFDNRASVWVPAPAPTPTPAPAPAPAHRLDCGGLCKYRCSQHSRQNLCTRACGTCCVRCKCVPPGTSGNREMCGTCYTREMQRNLQMQDCNNGESELDSEHLLMALRKEAEQLVMVPWKSLIPIVEGCILKVGIHSAQQAIKPIMDDSIRKIKDEIESAVAKKLVSQKWNSTDETTTPIPRDYKLKFFDQVSDPVFTGMEIKGKEGTDIKVALVHDATEVPVDSGPESSTRVEIFLDAGVEDLNNSSVIGNDNPHFHTPINVKLEKGIGTLPKNVKLVHKSKWIKRCNRRLGARVAQIFDGSRIKEAFTESFAVLDKRRSLYEKHRQPSLFDKVWRLKNIAKNGARHIRLRKSNISTVQQFLFLHSVDPQRLQEIFGRCNPAAWRGTVYHASKCDIDDKKVYLHYSSSSAECKNGVVFDVVGQLKGVLRNNGYVPIESVAEAEKDDARKLLANAFENREEASACEYAKKATAFENWKDIDSFDDEASLLCKFPCIFNDENPTNSTGLDGHFAQYLGNADYLNEPPCEDPNSFSDPLPLWHFDDNYELWL